MSINGIQVERIVQDAMRDHAKTTVEAAKIEARGRIIAALIEKGSSAGHAAQQARNVIG